MGFKKRNHSVNTPKATLPLHFPLYKNKPITETDRKRKFVGILYILFAWLDLLTVNDSQPFSKQMVSLALNTFCAKYFYPFINENRYLQYPF